MKKFIFLFLAIIAIILPSFALAAPNLWPTGFWGPLISCLGNYSGGGTLPPCTSLCDLINTIENIIYFAISIVIFILAPILFAWGGILYMISRGSPDGLTKAKSVLTKTLLGVAIVLCAWLIVNTFINVLGIGSSVGGFGAGMCSVAPNAATGGSNNGGISGGGGTSDAN